MVSTLAGSDLEGFADGKGAAARFEGPEGIAVDAAGNLYVADAYNQRIRKITPEGEVSTLAGSGEYGFADGEGRNAQFRSPSGITIDTAGNLYVADVDNHRIRKVTPEGEVSTLAGSGPTGYENGGFADGEGNKARFNYPHGIAIDGAGNLYVADFWNYCIRKITAKGEVSTFAGGKRGFANGTGGAARFYTPVGIALDAAGNLYVAEVRNPRIRKITPQGAVSTFAGGKKGFADGTGSAVRFSSPYGIAIDAAGNLYVTDGINNRIRRIAAEGKVTTLAGGGDEDGDCLADGEGSAARFCDPRGIAIDAEGNLYVADSHNNRIRKIVIQHP
jgi:DNA-binding beta-propeller fold protein YncE